MNTPNFLPWHPQLLKLTIEAMQSEGVLPLFDVEVSSYCNVRCPKCDSCCLCRTGCPGHGAPTSPLEPASPDIQALCRLIAESEKKLAQFKQGLSPENEALFNQRGFVCGKGEPTEGFVNLPAFEALLEQTTINWSAFSNGINWPESIWRLIESGRLSVLIQHNSAVPELIAQQMGIPGRLDLVEQHLSNRRRLYQLSKSMAKQHPAWTTIAVSIVPETGNLDELEQIVTECLEHDVSLNIGELERSGRADDEYHAENSVSNEKLIKLLQFINQQAGVSYRVPFCPGVFGSIHIDNRGNVLVDKHTGLSCPWFGMRDPEPHVIGNIAEMSYDKICKAIFAYRRERLPYVRPEDYPEMVFGGCGGNARPLIRFYLGTFGR